MLDRNVMLEWNGPGLPSTQRDPELLRTLITPDGWKMNLGWDGAGELFHLAQDPAEMENQFYREESLSSIQRLTAEFNLWQRSTGDAVLAFDPQAWEQRRRKS